jgi:hypothetical protein
MCMERWNPWEAWHANAACRHKRISENFHNITITITFRYEFLSVVRCGYDQQNLENIRDLANQTPRSPCSLTSVFGEAPINCSSASFPSRQIQTFYLNKLFIRAVEAHQWGCNCLEGGSHASRSWDVSNGRLDRQTVEKPNKIPQPPEQSTPNTFAKSPRTLTVQTFRTR